MSVVLRPVILSGGAGTRLWPLSTEAKPKQFLELVGEPLMDQALRRLSHVPGVAGPVIVTGTDHVGLVVAASSRAGVEPHLTIVEPEGRNTGPAVVAAALASDPNDVLVVLPADHLIEDRDGFGRLVEQSSSLAFDGMLVTFGIVPTRAEVGYGYIEVGEELSVGHRVSKFTEKPDLETAEVFVAGGRHLWNSGIFMFRADVLVDEARAVAPTLSEAVESAMQRPTDGVLRLDARFASAQSISLDHAVMEKTEKAAVVPADIGWSDLGSWESVWEAAEKDASGNAVMGDVVTIGVSGSLVRAEGRRVALAGVNDVIVVETDHAILVVGKQASQEVRELAALDRPVEDQR